MGAAAALCLLLLMAPFVKGASADEREQEPYEKHCAACHGERGEGAIGPALLGTKLSFEEFAATTREGRGMMPAIPASDLSDEGLAEIYGPFAGIEGEPPPPAAGFQALSGKMLSRDGTTIIGWGSVAITLLGLAIAARLRWGNWSSSKVGRRYYWRLGIPKLAAIFFRTLFVDTLSVSSVWKKDRRRWAVHALILGGFAGLIAADILIAIYNPSRQAMPLASPFKILANISGLSIAAGLGIVIYRAFGDPYWDNGETLKGDIAFVAILAIVVLTGFAVEATRRLGLFEYTTPIYSAHIISVAAILVSAPFTRLSHIASTFLLVLSRRLADAVAEGGKELRFRDEPAPGRHHKSERLAAEIGSRLFAESDRGKVVVRYYP